MPAKKEKTGLKNARAAQPPVPAVDKEWQAEDDARTMMRHAEICADKKRHDAAMAKLQKQKKAITSLEDLKKMHQEKYGANAAHEKAEGDED